MRRLRLVGERFSISLPYILWTGLQEKHTGRCEHAYCTVPIWRLCPQEHRFGKMCTDVAVHGLGAPILREAAKRTPEVGGAGER